MNKDNIPNSKLDAANEELNPNNMLDEQWEALSQDWQAQPFEKVDAKALLKQTKKRTFWAKGLLILNIVATLAFIIAVCVMLYSGSEDKTTLAYLIFGAAGSIIFVYYEIKIRLAVWKQVAASPEKAIENAIKGIESSISYIRLTKFSSFILVPACNWYVYEMAIQHGKAVLGGIITVNVTMAIMLAITHWFHVKRLKELKQLKQLVKK